MKALGLLAILAVVVVLRPQNAASQHPAVPKLTLSQVEQLVSSKVPDSTLSTQIQKRGLAFTPTPAIEESLRAKGAGPLTLSAIEALFSKGSQSVVVSRTQITLGSGLSRPRDIAVDGNGNIFVSDSNGVDRILADGGYTKIQTLKSPFPFTFGINGIAVDLAGNVFVSAVADGSVMKILAVGGYTNIKRFGYFMQPHGVAVDKNDNVFIAEYGRESFTSGTEVISESAVKELLAANGHTAAINIGGGFNGPRGIAIDRDGNVFAAEAKNNAVKEVPFSCASSDCVKTLGGGFNRPFGVAVDGMGNVLVADTGNNAVKEIPSGCVSAECVKTLGSGFNAPEGVAVDRMGNIFVADSGNNRVVELKVAGPETTQDVVAQPTDRGPSLAATMQFVQDKLSQQGQVEYVTTFSNQDKPGVILRQDVRGTEDSVVADTATCTLHDSASMDQSTERSSENNSVATVSEHSQVAGTVDFKDVEKVNVESLENLTHLKLVQNHHPELTPTVAPPIFAVELSASMPLFSLHESTTKGSEAPKVTDKTDNDVVFVFRDEEMANRVANAMRHAVELCGGGNKEPF